MMLLDLVTMPLTEMSLFMSSGLRSLITLCSFRLNGRTCVHPGGVDACTSMQPDGPLSVMAVTVADKGSMALTHCEQLALWQRFPNKIFSYIPGLNIKKSNDLSGVRSQLVIQLSVILVHVH